MQTELNRDLMIGMLRKGLTGDQILQILNVITSSQDVVADVTESEALSA